MRLEINPTLDLLFGARVRFLDGIHGDLTGICLDSESRTVTGIGVSRNLNEDQIYVSIDVVAAGFPDYVHLDQRRDSMAAEPGPRCTWLTPDQPVRWTAPDWIGARLKGVIVDQETGRLRTLVIAAGRRESLLCLAADEVMEIPSAVVSVRRGATQWIDLPEYRVDENAQEGVPREEGREGLPSPKKTEALPADAADRRQVE